MCSIISAILQTCHFTVQAINYYIITRRRIFLGLKSILGTSELMSSIWRVNFQEDTIKLSLAIIQT